MSLSGMTGFARIEGSQGDWSWAVEARSVNGRNLETRVRAPNGFDSLERTAREGAQARFARGQLTVNVQAKKAETVAAVRVNQELLNRYLELSRAQVAAGNATPPSADGLLALRGVLEAVEDDEDADARAGVEAALAADIGHALDALKTARLAEGAALLPVLTAQVDHIAQLVGRAEAEAGRQTEAIKERFSRRLNELLADTSAMDERIVQEAAVLAVKADVREELDRLTAHIAAARTLLGAAGAGRRLDFLAQEFMREANTLCSKSATTALTAVGLELKAVIEQLREQIQNVE
ncbi:MAG: YicC family protein [Caulobacteraceae bacterium]|nr:YicC family protein [Caulobacteraceae bacterium]